jgi:hypothetical protein
MAAKPPERHDGPTPNGGAYSIAYFRDDGSMEIVEFDADGKEIHRTYGEPRAKV